MGILPPNDHFGGIFLPNICPQKICGENGFGKPFLISGSSKPFLIFVSLWVAQTVSYNMVPAPFLLTGGGVISFAHRPPACTLHPNDLSQEQHCMETHSGGKGLNWFYPFVLENMLGNYIFQA